jgi:hypothetical protein
MTGRPGQVNRLDYDNVHQPPHRRCATFDGPESFSDLKTLPNQARGCAKDEGTRGGPAGWRLEAVGPACLDGPIGRDSMTRKSPGCHVAYQALQYAKGTCL